MQNRWLETNSQPSKVSYDYVVAIISIGVCAIMLTIKCNPADIGGEGGPTAEERAKLEEEERERLLALQEAEELRKEKHRKMEEEREKMRQGVREKVS